MLLLGLGDGHHAACHFSKGEMQVGFGFGLAATLRDRLMPPTPCFDIETFRIRDIHGFVFHSSRPRTGYAEYSISERTCFSDTHHVAVVDSLWASAVVGP